MTEGSQAGARFCRHCRRMLPLAGPVGRRESCPFCGADLRICRNCRFFDPRAYNDCREPQAERVLDKDRANCCDYFVFRAETGLQGPSASETMSARERLEALFPQKP